MHEGYKTLFVFKLWRSHMFNIKTALYALLNLDTSD